jgi:hypothetical protein
MRCLRFVCVKNHRKTDKDQRPFNAEEERVGFPNCASSATERVLMDPLTRRDTALQKIEISTISRVFDIMDHRMAVIALRDHAAPDLTEYEVTGRF